MPLQRRQLRTATSVQGFWQCQVTANSNHIGDRMLNSEDLGLSAIVPCWRYARMCQSILPVLDVHYRHDKLNKKQNTAVCTCTQPNHLHQEKQIRLVSQPTGSTHARTAAAINTNSNQEVGPKCRNRDNQSSK